MGLITIKLVWFCSYNSIIILQNSKNWVWRMKIENKFLLFLIMSYELGGIIVNFGKHVGSNSISSPRQKTGADTLFLSFFFFLQFVRFSLLSSLLCFLFSSFLFPFFFSPSPRFLCSQLFLSFLALQFGLWYAFMGFISLFLYLFRVCGFYERICCGVEGVGSVNGSAMVDGFDFFVICEVVDGKQRW